MSRDIQNSKELLIVSDTGMYQLDNEISAFGPVVNEVKYFSEEFDSITWLGYTRMDQINNKAYLTANQKKVSIIMLPRIGGKNLKSKIQIVLQYPKMFLLILKLLRTKKYVHVRAPSHPALITMLLSYFFHTNQFWFKYAGSWVDKASPFYEFQRGVLKKLAKNCKITVNGKWKNKKETILAFENPCINNEDRINGKSIVDEKVLGSKMNFCFVGALNPAKGVDLILKVLKDFPNKSKIGTFYFVGGGSDILDYKSIAIKIDIDIQFIGYQPKDKIIEIYKICHFIVLPSKAEGFPKVISEGMNFGCIPIVSDISAIGQYIKHKENGFLLDKVNAKSLKENFLYALELSTSDHRKILDFNLKITSKFTYEYYINRMNNEIFKKK